MRRLAALTLSLGLLFGMAGGPLAQPASAASLKICGEVTVYVKATALATGLLTINGVPFVIAVGTVLPAGIAVGADVCADLTTNLLGLVTGAAVSANIHIEVKVCGVVQAYTAATALATGLLRIGGHTYTLGLGSTLPASVDVGADLCIDLDIDGFGRVADGTVTANAHVQIKVCGTVTAYTEATATAVGLLKIGSKSWTLAVLSKLPASVQVGADLCIELELDGYGRVSDGEVAANVESTVRICGTVTSYAAATASALGQLKVVGHSWVVALATQLPASVQAGADLCLGLTLNGFLQVKDGTAVANIVNTLDVCGQVTAYVAATPTADGSLTIAGVVRKVRAGADVDAAVGVGAYLKLRLTTDVFARVAKASVLKIGASLAGACNDPTPPPSPNPGSSQGPGASQEPGSSQAPGSSPDPGSSQHPGESNEPGTSAPPTGNVDSCVDGGIGTVGRAAGDGTLLPSTDALRRATGVIASNAIPLLALGLLGGLAAWYRSRRRHDEYALTNGPEPGEPGVHGAETPYIPGASSHDEASEDRP